MVTLVRAELGKAAATRSFWVIGAIGVVFCVGWAALDVFVFGGRSEDAYGMAQQGYLFALILGILLTAGEYRHQTITWAFLVTPGRGRVITAKLVTNAVIGAVLGIAAVIVTAPAAAIMLSATDRAVYTPGVPGVLVASVLTTALWGVFGAALGLLIRNQTAAVVIAFVWFFYVEWVLIALVPAVGRWTPTGVSKAVIGMSRAGFATPGDLLPQWAAIVVFLAYCGVVAAGARVISVRRDVT
ncbi:hypothetical protein [Actinocrispum wychmicini]|uniref:ABC-2 type transport system permease protein n=1 Tax=Actinocrispum wychmicini TaxID=1213861 RepID=A0A4R2JQV3_9PSEU|nr:hypothetical protein [Actinocrispum wychmicini]TCO59189.1 ABC-2 type transport system permease protein [Actinocrispum wychmicini]